jgi:hypothetical protein
MKDRRLLRVLEGELPAGSLDAPSCACTIS